MLELYGLEQATENLRVAGATDMGLARSLLGRAGAPCTEATVARVLESYLAHLQAVLVERAYHPIGDVAATVAGLRARGTMAGLATGNVRRGAEIKLASAGLLSVFHLDHGGYGSDAELRADIVRTAIARCDPGSSDVIVVGDTERDVAAARAVGARVVGVATDEHARAELTAAGADVIVADCGEALLRELLV
jgi:phosphoglycolate phosphatase-like HAD superfamily hydrolase